MPTYTVHEPPLRKDESVPAPERFVFVRDGFYFWAFVLPPVWLFVRRLWLALLIYFAFSIVLAVGLKFAGLSSSVQTFAEVLVSLAVGFEASSIWRWTLARRKWKTLGFVVGEDREIAERRFFGEWAKNAQKNAQMHAEIGEEPTLEATYSRPVWRGQPAPSDVIGLFPEPGQQR